MIKEIQIWDFDGTLVDSSHRYRTIVNENGEEKIDLDYWIRHEDLTFLDSFIPETVKEFKKACDNPEIYAVIATARIWCEQSQELIELEGITPDAIYSRRNREDTRRGADLKIQAVKKLLNLKQFKHVDSVRVFEDNVQYLKTICDEFNAKGYYFPSNQGH